MGVITARLSVFVARKLVCNQGTVQGDQVTMVPPRPNGPTVPRRAVGPLGREPATSCSAFPWAFPRAGRSERPFGADLRRREAEENRD